jgi:peptidoglycan hydrolase CwlO-like protein
MNTNKDIEVPLPQGVEESIKNTEDISKTLFSDLDDVGKVVDQIKASQSAMTETIEQLKEEMKKMKHEQDVWKIEIKKLIKDEIGKQVKPLAEEVGRLTKSKPKFIWILPRLPFFHFRFKKKVD